MASKKQSKEILKEQSKQASKIIDECISNSKRVAGKIEAMIHRLEVKQVAATLPDPVRN